MPNMSTLKILVLTLSLFLSLGLTAAKSDITRQFKDWHASCDDTGNCKGVTTDISRANTGVTYRLEIARQHGREAFWTLSFIIQNGQPKTGEPFHISVDFKEPVELKPDEGYQSGAQPDTFNIISVNQANTLMKLFARGNETFFNYLNSRGQETAARFSLKGLSASLLWIDDQQKRLNSPRSTGDMKIASTPGKTNSTNTFTSGNTAVLAPVKIPSAIGKLHFADGECLPIEKTPLASFGFETALVDKNQKLYLIPCFTGAYNIIYRVYLSSVIDNHPTQLFFASYSDTLGWTGTPDLINITYDAETKSLSSFYKGRGLGDCGSTVLYRWEQYSFKMVEYRYWDKCDGTRQPQDWPVIYPTPKTK